ncbi:MAG: glycosyltransferase, partial [Candidatus Methylomirabilis sp.]
RMGFPAEEREIIVVDNGSTDRTAEIVKRYPVRYLWEERRGAASARNRGIEASQGKILAFTNADCVVTTEWLTELTRGFDEDGIGAVEGKTVAYPPVTSAERYRAMTRSSSHQGRHASPLAPYVSTANVAFRREVFDRIGLFDPRLEGALDNDFTVRFFQGTDLTLRYNPKAIVFLRHRRTGTDFFRQYMKYGRGLAMLRAKYPERLPWGWQQELRAWAAVGKFGLAAAEAAVRYGGKDGKVMDTYSPYFTFLRKLAVRLGFLRGMLAGGLQ